MRDFQKELDQTCKLLRSYMEQHRPQSFASLYTTYSQQRRRCDIYGIKLDYASYQDIEQYAKEEKIERFKF